MVVEYICAGESDSDATTGQQEILTAEQNSLLLYCNTVVLCDPMIK